MRVLYLSYDGALDPLGRSQVVPYLEGLAARGVRYDLLTFEKPARWQDREARDAMRARLEASGIRWHPLPYHKRPPVLSTAFDLAAAIRRTRKLVGAEGVELLHARSYPAALAARLAGEGRIPYLFDMRGFWADERVDGGLWPRDGLLYRTTRRVERDLLRDAAAVVTLTRASLPELRGRIARSGGEPRVAVVPTCVDLERFRVLPAPEGPFTLAYFGSVGTWYLLDEMLSFARVVLERAGGGRLRLLTNEEPGLVRARAARAGFPADGLEVDSVPHERVPAALRGVHATFFFIRPGRSSAGFHQTKLGESLALGIPVAANQGIGDTTQILEGRRVGVVVKGLDEGSYREAAERLVARTREAGVRGRCRRTAEEIYDLREGVAGYHRLYTQILDAAG